jgi:G2/M phase-specific E3 ubiquitin-protein ligase
MFCDTFESFCNKHVPDPNKGKKHGYECCTVCLSPLSTYHPADSIIASCCLKLPDWFRCFVHKKCVVNYTMNAGYDSICINCSMNDGEMSKEKWQQEMRQKGIFIPMRMASWELDGRFKDQVKNKCVEKDCKYRKENSNVWTCYVCGCFPKHLKCAQVKSPVEYYCQMCWDQSFVQRVPKF